MLGVRWAQPKAIQFFTKAIVSDEKKSVPLVAIENIKKPNYWLGFDISKVEFSQTELCFMA